MEKKKKTATITFHASHNYGSMLQAYALQQTLLGLGVDNEIINLRTGVQRSLYPNPACNRKVLKQWVKSIMLRSVKPFYNRDILIKYELFEKFLNDCMTVTREYGSGSDLEQLASEYDYFITGSDQCWNTCCGDFDWSYYLPFTDSPNKISYASSLGPVDAYRDWNRIVNNLRSFRAISVREEGTAAELRRHLDRDMDISVMPDPTLLLSVDEWKEIVTPQRIVSHPYIFLYTPAKQRGLLELAGKASRILGMPVVVSNITDTLRESLIIFRDKSKFEYVLNTGPREFLNLILNAELVLSGSFHALIFSILFHRPFFSFRGLNDNRTKQLLNVYGFKDRTVDTKDATDKLLKFRDVDFSQADNIIGREKSEALVFLKNALDAD